jgi:hypothetical protein
MKELIQDIRDLMCDRSVKNAYLIMVILLMVLSWISLGLLMALNTDAFLWLIGFCGAITLAANGLAIVKFSSKGILVFLSVSILLNFIAILIH